MRITAIVSQAIYLSCADREPLRIVQSSRPFLVAQWKYQMTLIWIFALNRSPDSFRQGVNAFRNAREWAMEKRDEFIAAVKRQGTNVCIY